jgi:general secretion pathway protein A
VAVLEHLHVLLNYQRDSRSFLSILLIGLPELRETLARNILSSLNARLPVRLYSEPLDVVTLAAYLQHRMNIAGSAKSVFSQDAALCIREATGGVMRKVDVLAFTALEIASATKGTVVDGGIIQEAVQLCAEALR